MVSSLSKHQPSPVTFTPPPRRHIKSRFHCIFASFVGDGEAGLARDCASRTICAENEIVLLSARSSKDGDDDDDDDSIVAFM
jgi:hypothetical protein